MNISLLIYLWYKFVGWKRRPVQKYAGIVPIDVMYTVGLYMQGLTAWRLKHASTLVGKLSERAEGKRAVLYLSESSMVLGFCETFPNVNFSCITGATDTRKAGWWGAPACLTPTVKGFRKNCPRLVNVQSITVFMPFSEGWKSGYKYSQDNKNRDLAIKTVSQVIQEKKYRYSYLNLHFWLRNDIIRPNLAIKSEFSVIAAGRQLT